jgi:hypothetical protein
MSLGDIANTSQGPMVGDYISTSFSQSVDGSRDVTTVIAIGNPHTVAQPFDEAMYVPSTPLGVTGDTPNPASSAGVQATTGEGAGTAHQAIRNN